MSGDRPGGDPVRIGAWTDLLVGIEALKGGIEVKAPLPSVWSGTPQRRTALSQSAGSTLDRELNLVGREELEGTGSRAELRGARHCAGMAHLGS